MGTEDVPCAGPVLSPLFNLHGPSPHLASQTHLVFLADMPSIAMALVELESKAPAHGVGGQNTLLHFFSDMLKMEKSPCILLHIQLSP